MKSCKYCSACKRVYRKYNYRFGVRPIFYCVNHDRIVKGSERCGMWRPKNPEYDLSPERFDEVETDIKALMSLLKEL